MTDPYNFLLSLNIYSFEPKEKLKEQDNEHPYTLYVDLPAVNILPHLVYLLIHLYTFLMPHLFSGPLESDLYYHRIAKIVYLKNKDILLHTTVHYHTQKVFPQSSPMSQQPF